MSGAPSYEDAVLVRAGVIGAACGLGLVAFGYALVGALVDRFRR